MDTRSSKLYFLDRTVMIQNMMLVNAFKQLKAIISNCIINYKIMKEKALAKLQSFIQMSWQTLALNGHGEMGSKSGTPSLKGKICIVTGASRGIGKGIAIQLGGAGATVYITGRTLLPYDGITGSLVETAEEVEERGGKCIPVKCNHINDEDVKDLFERVYTDHGRLDILVNNAYDGHSDILNNLKIPFWKLSPEIWDKTCDVGLRSHYVAAVLAAEIMVLAKRGLIVNISSRAGMSYLYTAANGVGKAAVDRMAADCAVELKPHNVAFVSLWPGMVRTELLTEIVDGGQDGVKDVGLDLLIDEAESPEFTGKAVVHLAEDPNIMKKSGRILWTVDLANEYGYTDIDGRMPPNFRSLRVYLLLKGRTWLAHFTPSFIQCPFWLLSVINVLRNVLL